MRDDRAAPSPVAPTPEELTLSSDLIEIRDLYLQKVRDDNDYGHSESRDLAVEEEAERFDNVLASLQRAAAVSALRDAAGRIETYARRMDNRFTEHAVAEAGGADMLREYAGLYEELAGATTTPPAPQEG